MCLLHVVYCNYILGTIRVVDSPGVQKLVKSETVKSGRSEVQR